MAKFLLEVKGLSYMWVWMVLWHSSSRSEFLLVCEVDGMIHHMAKFFFEVRGMFLHVGMDGVMAKFFLE
ncbi:NLP effector protein [Dirofilaria immitis]